MESSGRTHTVLIADDDEYLRDTLAEFLEDSGHELLFSATAKETWETIEQKKPDLVLLDIRFPDCQDLTLLKRIRQEAQETEIIVISSQTDDVSQIVESVKLGAFDYVPKPIVPEELRNRIGKALNLKNLQKSQEFLLNQLQERDGVARLAGESRAMRQVRETIRKLADMMGCVLIRGESGTGKELAARALHYLSHRRTSPFVVVNCAAIPEALVESTLFGHRRGAFTGAIESSRGKFEVAEDGTIFLDEIGDMPLSQQTSLLRVLESRRFTPVGENRERDCRARFLLATNKDLRELVRNGTFREDLFYRINVATIFMPPLRNRPEDVAPISEMFCNQLALEMGRSPVQLSSDVRELFERYDWPGNVRELKNVLEAAIMLSDATQEELTLRHLPPELLAIRDERNASGSQISIEERHEREKLINALQQTEGNQSKAAKILGCHRNTIRAKIRYYGIVTPS